MAVRTVRLDPETEEILAALARDTGMSVSGVLKQGLLALRDQRLAGIPDAFEVYRQLDLGPGGYALAPSTETRKGVTAVLRARRRR